MRNLKTYSGEGAIIAGGKEYPISYSIEATESGNTRRADGLISGLDEASVFALHTLNEVKLRMADGLVVAIVLTGGPVTGDQRFSVNDRLPGL